jgi:hypothetical protein
MGFEKAHKNDSTTFQLDFIFPENMALLTEMCLNKICNKICMGKCISLTFFIQNYLIHGNSSILMLLIFTLDYGIRKINEKQ